MCRRVECSKCKRPTYAGCGAHIEQVLADVPPAERCHCREDKAAAADDSKPTGLASWFKNMMGV